MPLILLVLVGLACCLILVARWKFVKTKRSTIKPQTRSVADMPKRSSNKTLPCTPSLILARHRRQAGFDVCKDGTSWFGGLPALGQEDWPKAQDGSPMTPLAQIDLAQAASKIDIPGLPTSGSLAFFGAIDLEERKHGAVRYVPGPVGEPSPQPAGLRALQDGSVGGLMRKSEPATEQLLFPRMAIEMIAVNLAGDGGNNAEMPDRVAAILGPAREYNLSKASFGDVLGAKNLPINRDSVARFMAGAQRSFAEGDKVHVKLKQDALRWTESVEQKRGQLAHLKAAATAPDAQANDREAYEAALKKQKSTEALAKRLVTEDQPFEAECKDLQATVIALENWSSRGNLWAMLDDAEQEEIAPLLARWTGFGELGHRHLQECDAAHTYLSDANDETLRVMAVASDDVFAELPQVVRQALNGPYRMPIQGYFHQMFGKPANIQTAAEENSHRHLLLQLHSDDVQGFTWGDFGVIQFWIGPDDLAAGNFDAAVFTYECH